jgi:hypothetical protein
MLAIWLQKSAVRSTTFEFGSLLGNQWFNRDKV